MPKHPNDDLFMEFAFGYALAIGALAGGDSDEWADITHENLSRAALERIFYDCEEFFARAEELHPEGEEGLGRIDNSLSLGWFFGSARMGTPHSFEFVAPGPFGVALDRYLEKVIKLDLALNDDRQIFFRN